MKKSPLENLFAFGSGALFAVGLAVAGMTQPAKVVSFLDVTGNWDPSLAFVMIGAIAVYSVASRMVLKKRANPIVGTGFYLPTRKDIEPNLVIGAGLFGIGWGLAGYCPGPGLTSLGSGAIAPFGFVLMMVLGMRLFDVFQRYRSSRSRETMPATSTATADR